MRCRRTRNKRKGSNIGEMQENPKQNKGIKSGGDAEEPQKKKKKVSNLGAMLENPNQKEGIESRYDAGEPKIKKEGIESRSNAREPETKLWDQIRARCLRSRNKTKGSNPGAMLDNLKQWEGIKSGSDA